ncbi:hypothetical protein jhhlp_005977 [Lomentospora prolificans]|uniref:Major facilitator superfamily (MFS) profile domain-containing protein n=1 Tax=Lomentospora prolificans TaxID=41688 RepID=A0A2N3N4M6_9PEZI|nr:hypothetical protein jhhlp_005977 [Lomentospora prolificans]
MVNCTRSSALTKSDIASPAEDRIPFSTTRTGPFSDHFHRHWGQTTIMESTPPAEKGEGDGKSQVPEALTEQPSSATRSKLQTSLLMMALCLAIFLAALDITILSTALATVAEHFQSTSAFVWVGSAFQIAASAVTATWGKLSDIWGRRAILLCTVAVFFVGSALCATAVSLAMEILGRAVQGCGAGGILALCTIVIADLYSPRERGKYYAMTGMVWATAAALGPVVGGAFTKNVSWRWCFYLNLPISGVAFVVIFFTLKLQAPKTSLTAGIKYIDWLGTLTLTGGIVMFLLGLQLGSSTYPWNSATVIGLIVGGASTLALFILVEWVAAPYPLVPMHLYANVSNFATILVNLFHSLAFTQVTYFLPLYFQAVLGSSSLASGVMLLPFVLSLSFASAAVAILFKVTGNYIWVIRLGFVVAVLGTGLFYNLPISKSWPRIIIYQIIAGAGLGAIFQAPLLALQSNVSPQENGAATASFSLMRNLASGIGVVIGSVAFANKMDAQRDNLAQKIGPALAAAFSGDRAQASLLLVNQLDESTRVIVQQAFFTAIRDVFIQMVSYAGAGLLVCLFIRDAKLNETHTEVKTGIEGKEQRRRIARENRGKASDSLS